MTTTTTIDPRYTTSEQIRALRHAARLAGDYYLAEWCDLALSDYETHDADANRLVHAETGRVTTRSEARQIVADVLNEAAARARAEAESEAGQ